MLLEEPGLYAVKYEYNKVSTRPSIRLGMLGMYPVYPGYPNLKTSS